MSSLPREAGSLPLLIAVLDRYREPLFVIDATRRILFRNLVGARVLKGRGGDLCERHGRLSLGAASADEQLRAVLQRSPTQHRRSHGIRVVRPKSNGDWLLLIHPLNGGTTEPPAPSLYFIQGLGRLAARDGQLLALSDLFGFTVREIAVARELLRTGSVAATAKNLSLSIETIRTYLKRIFRKCDVHSKSELMTILLWLAEFPGGV